MASLMEELIDILNEEDQKYKKLLELSKRKTPIIINGDITELQAITDEEQLAVDQVNSVDKRRISVMNDIAEVLNKDVQALKISNLIEILEKRPEERDKLAKVHDSLKSTVGELVVVNDSNRVLIRQSLDMIDFNLSLAQSIRSAPETGDYTKDAGIAGNVLGASSGGFDARQ
ncbi:MAG: flagellar protein FlgN [Lachnospiraceae bacterium]|nr:flagellar protein FlgN [Lachnospiraceae bacterium]